MDSWHGGHTIIKSKEILILNLLILKNNLSKNQFFHTSCHNIYYICATFVLSIQ